MTDTPPVPPTPEPATPPAAPAAPTAAATPQTPPAAPAAPAAAPYAATPAGPAPKQSLSLGAMITGIAAFVLSWIFGLGLIPGIVALVLGFQAKKKEPDAPKFMWITGVAGGAAAILISLIVGIVTILSVLLPLLYLGQISSTIP